MLTAFAPELELNDVWLDIDPRKRWRVAFPINKSTGAEHTAVVYFEVAPGDHQGIHQDSAEEIVYIVAGEGEANVGDERGHVRAGDIAVIPAMVPHGVVNTGDEPLKVVGFFCESEVTSTFESPLQPIGWTSRSDPSGSPTSLLLCANCSSDGGAARHACLSSAASVSASSVDALASGAKRERHALTASRCRYELAPGPRTVGLHAQQHGRRRCPIAVTR